jgi:TatA/E family protein of Tat protein translocase
MFNMNPFEMVVIGIIALVVVGPKGLPEIGRMVGKWMRTFREAADEMKRGLYFEDDYRPSTPRRIPTTQTSEPKKDIGVTGTAEAVVVDEPQESTPVAAAEKAEETTPEEASSRPPLIPPYDQNATD